MSKLEKIGYYNMDTGEIIENGIEVIENIKKEEISNTIKALCWKMENNPYNMTLEELNAYRIMVKKKKNKIIKYNIKSGEFVTLMIMDRSMVKELSIEAKSMLYEIAMLTNKSGVLLYNNNRPIPSFEKLKLYLEIGHSRWSKIKSDIDKYDIIVKRKDKNNRNILLVNPMYCTTSTEVTEMRFITFGHILKDRIDFEDYLYLCKLYEIIPEYDNIVDKS